MPKLASFTGERSPSSPLTVTHQDTPRFKPSTFKWTRLFLLSTTPTCVEGSHRQHLLLQLWQVIKSREHKSVFTALYFSYSSLVSTGNSDVVLPARACILHLFPFIIMNSLPLHWHVVPTQTHGPFLKAQIKKAATKWKHEVKNMTPSASDGPALLQHLLLRLLLSVQSAWSSSGWIFFLWQQPDVTTTVQHQTELKGNHH